MLINLPASCLRSSGCHDNSIDIRMILSGLTEKIEVQMRQDIMLELCTSIDYHKLAITFTWRL